MNKISIVIIGLLLLLAVGATLYASMYFLFTYRWPLPYTDQWIDLANIKGCIGDGDCSLKSLFSLHNQHSVFFTRLLHIIEYKIFSGSNVFLSNVAFLALSGITFSLYKIESNKVVDLYRRLFIASACIIFIISPVNIFSCLHSFNIQWFLCYLFGFYAIHFFTINKGVFEAKQIFCIGASVLSCAGGFALLPTFVLLSYFLYGRLKSSLMYAVLCVLFIAIYFYNAYDSISGSSVELSEIDIFIILGTVFFNKVAFVISSLGGIVSRVDPIYGTIMGLFSFIYFMFVLCLCIEYKNRLDRLSYKCHMWLGIAIFSLFMIVELAIGRGGIGYELKPRFQLQPIIFWLSVMFLGRHIIDVVLLIGEYRALVKKVLGLWVVFPIIFIIASVFNIKDIDKHYSFISNKIHSSQHAYYSGVTSSITVTEAFGYLPLSSIKKSGEEVLKWVDFLRHHKLGIYAHFKGRENIGDSISVSLINELNVCAISKFKVSVNSKNKGVAYIGGKMDTLTIFHREFKVLNDKNVILAYGDLGVNTLFFDRKNRFLASFPVDNESPKGAAKVVLYSVDGTPFCVSELGGMRRFGPGFE